MLYKIFFIFIFFLNSGFIYLQNTYNKGARPVSAAPIWSSRKLTFYINTSQTTYSGSKATYVTDAQWQQAVTDAIKAWASVCNSDLTVELAGTTSTGWSTNGMNTIVYDNRTTAEGNVFGASTGTLGMALPQETSNSLYECDIAINGNIAGTWGTSGGSTVYDMQSTLVHEIGHCLGLDHSVEPPVYGGTYTSTNTILLDASMSAYVHSFPGDTVRRTINQDDNDGMSCLYQSDASFREGDNCTSYHGTNGGAAITGTVSGGPSDDLSSCLVKPEVTFTTTGVPGNGCAIKNTIKPNEPDHPFNEMFLMIVLVIFLKIKTAWKQKHKDHFV